jgi:hypothetical protein
MVLRCRVAQHLPSIGEVLGSIPSTTGEEKGPKRPCGSFVSCWASGLSACRDGDSGGSSSHGLLHVRPFRPGSRSLKSRAETRGGRSLWENRCCLQDGGHFGHSASQRHQQGLRKGCVRGNDQWIVQPWGCQDNPEVSPGQEEGAALPWKLQSLAEKSSVSNREQG